ncbi:MULTISPECIES: hypothetical protein [unclassified Enterococcus]|jgi:hypothetical protein|uniref:hypothetical protein n=1 Tax=unclassified Enterococcus TaxID=2608891 RepID=UPI003F284F5F
MNIISQYEQGYISYSKFLEEFPDSISESQEYLFGTRCVEFYVAVKLVKTDCHYYVQKYGGDQCEIIEGCSFEDTSVEDEQDPFGAVLA